MERYIWRLMKAAEAGGFLSSVLRSVAHADAAARRQAQICSAEPGPTSLRRLLRLLTCSDDGAGVPLHPEMSASLHVNPGTPKSNDAAAFAMLLTTSL